MIIIKGTSLVTAPPPPTHAPPAQVTVATINCSAQTTCNHIIQKLHQVCTQFSTNQGRVLKPKDSERLVLFLKDLNLPRPDKYATVQVHAFLSQLILYEGFYNSELEWVGVQKVCAGPGPLYTTPPPPGLPAPGVFVMTAYRALIRPSGEDAMGRSCILDSPPGRWMPAAVRMPACHSRRFKGERPIGAATG